MVITFLLWPKSIGEIHKSEALKKVIDYAIGPNEKENYYKVLYSKYKNPTILLEVKHHKENL